MGEISWIIIAVIAYLAFKYRGNIITFFTMSKMRQHFNSLSEKEKRNLLDFSAKYGNEPCSSYKNWKESSLTYRQKRPKNDWMAYVEMTSGYHVKKSGIWYNPVLLKKAMEADKRKMAKLANEREKTKKAEQSLAEKRKKSLIKKFGEKDANSILNHEVWQGMNIEMLNESLGNPMQKKSQVNKSKQKDQFFYNPRKTRMKTNKPTFRVDLEDGQVTGWKDLD